MQSLVLVATQGRTGSLLIVKGLSKQFEARFKAGAGAWY